MTEQDAERQLESCFSEEQIECLMAVFTMHHHSHSIEEVIGLEEELDDLEEDIT